MFLAGHATHGPEGLINVLNGGITRLVRPAFPAPLGLILVALIEMPTDHIGEKPIPVVITVTSPDGTETFARIQGTLVPKPNWQPDPEGVATTPLLFNLAGVLLTKPGRYKVNGTIAGKDTQSIAFEVVAGEMRTVTTVRPEAPASTQALDQSE